MQPNNIWGPKKLKLHQPENLDPEKTSHRKLKTLTPPKLGAKITVLVIAFQIALTLRVNIVTVSVMKGIKMQFLAVVGFKS